MKTVIFCLFLVLSLGACDGEDGEDGEKGVAGITGPSGVEKLTAESCGATGRVLKATVDGEKVTLTCVTP